MTSENREVPSITEHPYHDLNQYKKPTVMVDVVIFTILQDRLQLLLIRRGIPPYKEMWALPGGAVHLEEDDDLEAAARRELWEETGVHGPYMEQLCTYGSRTRDPRGWVVSVAYFALLCSESITTQSGSDALEACWYPVEGSKVPLPLAFDHQHIVSDAVQRLRAKLEYTSIAVHLLPTEFTLTELQRTYELLLETRLDKSSFRQRVRAAQILQEVSGKVRTGSNRPAQLYGFAKDKCDVLFFPRSVMRHAKGNSA